MKVNPVKVNQKIVNSLEKFSQNGGEHVSNYVNAAGKMFIAPLVILNNPFSHEDKENRKWAAIKQPVEAAITIAMQLLTVSLLFKGIDKIIKNDKLKFKFVEEASKNPKKIPEKIMASCNRDKTLALKKYQEQFNDTFKDRAGALLSIFTYIPILAISNKVYPKIARKLTGKNEN